MNKTYIYNHIYVCVIINSQLMDLFADSFWNGAYMAVIYIYKKKPWK